MSRFLGAIQFLTTLPVRIATAPPGACAGWFPFVGALIGLAGVPLGYVHPLLTVLAWVLLTGALHEDGLADCADAFRSGRSRERILEILKDSRIGTFGAIAIIFSILLRWQALASLQIEPWRAVIASHGISRAATVALAYTTPPSGSGLGALFARDLSGWGVRIAVIQALVAATLAGLAGFAGLVIGSLATVALRSYFLRRIGGVTGDCLGATCQVVEIAVLLTAIWQVFAGGAR